jgi:hypothetical protein
VLLGILGSIGALVVTRVSTPLLHTFLIPEAVDLSVNPRVLGFTLAVGVGTGLLFGLAPVFQAVRPNTTAALRDRGTVASCGRAAWLRSAFVILQIAVSLVLLVGAGLFLRTLKNAYSVELVYQWITPSSPLSISRRAATLKGGQGGPMPDWRSTNRFFPV